MKMHVLFFTDPELDQLWGYIAAAKASGEYSGNRKQFENRHNRIVDKILGSEMQDVKRNQSKGELASRRLWHARI